MFGLFRALAAAISVATALVSVAAAAGATPNPGQFAIPSTSPYGEIGTYASTGSVGALSVVTNPNNTVSSANVFTNVPGMNTTIAVPSGKKAILVARFSAETACVNYVGAWCVIRILVDGHEAAPATDYGFAFATVNAGAPGSYMWESCSMDRTYSVGPGTHKVQVQQSTYNTDGSTIFWLGERTLVVESALY